jgi:hypothetical protein
MALRTYRFLLSLPRWRIQDGRVRTFILTPGEKRVLTFVVAAFVLGASTKHYRDTHRRPSETAPASANAIYKSRSYGPAPSALLDKE